MIVDASFYKAHPIMNALRSQSQKAESLIHTSVGQGTESRRPTYGMHHVIKAVSLAHCGGMSMCKAYSLDNFFLPFRRALPYASMCKAFSLSTSHNIS